jgi:hypothetical protein
MTFQEVLQYLMAVSLAVWLVVEELIYRCGPSAVNTHEPLSATSPAASSVSPKCVD